MTLSNTTNKVSYTGDGSAKDFPITYKFNENSHIAAYLLDTLGAQTTLVLNTHYTLVGAGTESGGTLTMLTAPALGEVLTIIRSVPLTQETDYVENDTFPAESHEAALDKLTMAIQQLEEKTGRAIIFRETSGVEDLRLVPEASTVVGWNATGDDFLNYSALALIPNTEASKYIKRNAANTAWDFLTGTELRTDIGAAEDANTVHISGTEVISGAKTFSSGITSDVTGNLIGDVTGDVTGNVSGNAGTVTNGVYTVSDQTIAGVKTFSSSPIVPTPTTNFQPATKAYVDSLITGNQTSKNPGDILPDGSTNFMLSNNVTDATNDVDIGIGYTTASSGDAAIILATAMTKRLDANWYEGTNQGGLATGLTKTNSTWYHAYAILNPTSGVVDVWFDTSLTPTLPSGYTKSRYINSIYVQSTGIIRPFIQIGKEVFYTTRVLDINISSIPEAYTDITLSVPPGRIVEASVETYFTGSSTSGVILQIYIKDKNSNSERIVNALTSTSGSYQVSVNNNVFKTNTSAQIAYKKVVLSGITTSNALSLTTNGYRLI